MLVWQQKFNSSTLEYTLHQDGILLGTVVLLVKQAMWGASTDDTWLGAKLTLDEAKRAVEAQLKKDMRI